MKFRVFQSFKTYTAYVQWQDGTRTLETIYITGRIRGFVVNNNEHTSVYYDGIWKVCQ